VWVHEVVVVVLVAVVAYTCACTALDSETEKTEQVAFLVALAHNKKVLLERMAVVATYKQTK
jgi:hypothetical protein